MEYIQGSEIKNWEYMQRFSAKPLLTSFSAVKFGVTILNVTLKREDAKTSINFLYFQ